MLRQLTNSVFRQVSRSNAGAIPRRGAATKVALKNSMDDLPVPNGSWEAKYKANQTKYNLHLAIGVVFATVTLITAKTSGLVNLYLSPPDLPKD